MADKWCWWCSARLGYKYMGRTDGARSWQVMCPNWQPISRAGDDGPHVRKILVVWAPM